jgi:putative transcriptional regulator
MSFHHPDDALLMSYAAGSVRIPQAMVVAVHLCFCHECRSSLKKLNHLGGLMLNAITPASIQDDDFENLMQKIESEPSISQDVAHKNQHPQDNAVAWFKPLQRYFPHKANEIVWQRQTSSISKFDLSSLVKVPGFKVALQKINAGTKVPTHTHKGTEYTVVLQGGFSDELGVYHAGDFIERDSSHKHTPQALQNENCICLTVLNAPLQFTGWQRIFNPFLS